MPRSTRPPRAVSSTATSTSARRRIAAAPPGPVQSPGSTIRSSTRIPSEVVVPTWRPASSRMWVIRRVTVDLPLVPVIEMAGMRRASSRIQPGGVVPAASIRPAQCSSSVAWVPVRRTRRTAETDRPARTNAASAITRVRSAPVPGPRHHPPAGVGSTMHHHAPGVLSVLGTQAAGPGDKVRDGVGPLAHRDRCGRCGPGSRLGQPGSVPDAWTGRRQPRP